MKMKPPKDKKLEFYDLKVTCGKEKIKGSITKKTNSQEIERSYHKLMDKPSSLFFRKTIYF